MRIQTDEQMSVPCFLSILMKENAFKPAPATRILQVLIFIKYFAFLTTGKFGRPSRETFSNITLHMQVKY